MKTEKFKIIEFIRQYILLIDTQMDNFPRKEMELKNRIRMNSYDVLELTYEANTTEDLRIKRQLLLKALAKVKVVDFLLNMAFDKKIITAKKYYKFGEKMDDIVKYMIGYIKKLSSNNITSKKLIEESLDDIAKEQEKKAQENAMNNTDNKAS